MSNMRRRTGRKSVARNRRRRATRRRRSVARSLSPERLENRLLLAGDAFFPWHNMFVPTDVSGDLATTPRDALLIINELNKNGIRRLNDVADYGGEGEFKVFPDTVPDHYLTPLDALRVINQLNAEGEGPAKRASFQLEATNLDGSTLPVKDGMPQLVVGQDFTLTMTAQDIRPEADGVLVDGEFATGLFTAYADVSYDNPSLFDVIIEPTEDFRDAFTPGPVYSLFKEAHDWTENYDNEAIPTENEFDEIGTTLHFQYAFGPESGGTGGPDIDGDDIPDPKAVYPIISVDLATLDIGTLTFETNHHESPALAINFLYGPEGAPEEPAELIDYGMLKVDIVDWVNAVDDAFPVAPDQILEDSSATLDVLANDFLAEINTGTLTISSVTQPANGTTSISNGQVVFTPDANFFGTDSFTYTAIDGEGNEGMATVTVTVTNVNDAPVANDDEFTVAEDSGVNALNVLDNDLAGPIGLESEQISLLNIVASPSNGTAVISGNQIEYTPNDHFFGTDTLTYVITDGEFNSNTATVTINVTNVNDPPVANDDAFNIDEDSGLHDFAVLANDTPGPAGFETEALTIDAVDDPANGTATINGSVIQYTPDADFFGTDTFTYTISDTAGATDTATVTVTVANINDAPDAVADVLFVDELSADNVLNVLDNDSAGAGGESEAIEIINVTVPDAGGSVNIAADGLSLTYSPAAGVLGPYTETFDYTIQDVEGLTDTATVTINVEPVIRPRARDDSFNVLEDSSFADNVFDVTANDLFNDGATVLPISIGDGVNGLLQPAHGTIEIINDFSIRYQPDPDFFGTDSFEYQIDDDFVGGEGASDPDVGLVTVTVTNVNDAPIAMDDEFLGIQEDSTGNVLDVLANDEPGPANEAGAPVNDTVSVLAIVDQAANGVAEVVNGEVQYTPNANFFGNDTFTYSITDNGDLTDTATVTVTVDNVNDPPIANDDTFNIDEDSGVNALNVLSNDVPGPAGFESETISLAGIVAAPSHGVAVISGNQINYTPDSHFFGTDSFTYTVTDGDLESNVATVTINVANINDPPVANDDTFNINEDSGQHTFAVLINDTPGPAGFETEAISLDDITSPSNGTATIDGDTIRYTPDADFFGTDTFTYTISDVEGLTDTATVTVNVANLNDAPIAVDDVLFVDEFTIDNVLDVLANDAAGPAGESEAIEIIGVTTPDAGGTVTIAPNGLSLVYSPEPNSLGPYTETFEYTIEDTAGLVDTASVTITVEPVIRPRARDDSFDVSEDSIFSDNVLDVIGNDLFNDGATIAPLVIGDGANGLAQPMHGTIEVFEDFSIRYQPDPDFFGIDTFEYQIDDDFAGDDGASVPDIGLVTINVLNVNDAPVAVDDEFTDLLEDSGANTLDVLGNDLPGPANEAEAPVNDTVAVLAIVDQATNGVAAVVDGEVQYTPNADFFGTDSFTYSITDNGGLTDVATVSVTVTNVNDAPIASDDTFAGLLEDSVDNYLDVLANDVPGPANEAAAPINDSVAVLEITTQATHGVATVVNGQVFYTPNADYFGTDSFTYTVTDNDGLEDTATVNLTVDNVNDDPTAVPDVGESQLLALKDFDNQLLDVLLNDTIAPDINEELTIVGLGPGNAISIITEQGGTLTIENGGKLVSYTPADGFVGVDTFTYTISDGNGGSSSTTAEIDVVDAVPSTISGSVFMDVNGNGVQDPHEIGLSGVKITLSGTNIRGTEVNMTVQTDANGVFVFEDVLPNAVDDLVGYQISQQTPRFTTDGNDYISDMSTDENLDPGQAHNDLFTGIRPGLFGSDGRTEMNYHFGERGVTGKYITIAQYLASSNPGVALATNMDGDDFWFTVLKGWEGVQSAHVELADNLETAQLTITDADGNEQTRTISYAHYRLAGDRATGEYIIYFNGTAEDLGFDLAVAEGEWAGEGEPGDMLEHGGARDYADCVDKIFGDSDWA
jgi:hypothetical protein